MIEYLTECMVLFVKVAIGSVLWILVVCMFCAIIGILISIFKKSPEVGRQPPPDVDLEEDKDFTIINGGRKDG